MVDPVSLQNTVVRSSEVAKVQRVQDDKASLQAQAFSAELQRQTQKVEETVDSHQKTYQYDKDRKEKENPGKPASREKKNRKDGGEKPVKGEPLPGHLIDVIA